MNNLTQIQEQIDLLDKELKKHECDVDNVSMFEALIKKCIEETKIEESIFLKSRTHPLTVWRHCLAYVGYYVLGLTISGAGKALGKDHTTALHSKQVVIDAMYTEDRLTLGILSRVKSILKEICNSE